MSARAGATPLPVTACKRARLAVYSGGAGLAFKLAALSSGKPTPFVTTCNAIKKGRVAQSSVGGQASPATAASSTECAKSGHVAALLKGPWSILMLLMGKPNPWQTYTVVYTHVQGTTSGLGWATCKVDGGRAHRDTHHSNSVACCDVPRHIVGNHCQRLWRVNVCVCVCVRAH